MSPRIAPSSAPVSPSNPDRIAPVSPADPAWDVVDEWGVGSFPASDPPSNW